MPKGVIRKIDENLDALEEMHQKLRDNFAGKIVRKDLTKKIKEGANVPVYVLEYLLGMYCSSQDDDEDCCVTDPEQVLDHIFVDGRVKIHSKFPSSTDGETNHQKQKSRSKMVCFLYILKGKGEI